LALENKQATYKTCRQIDFLLVKIFVEELKIQIWLKLNKSQ
jgi:hypothetical protein